jgi:hypothetical protein
MNKKIAKKWVKALRSGNYKKSTGGLCQIYKNGNRSYCCLGVLTDLYNKENSDTNTEQSLWGGYLSYTVVDWAEMNSINGHISGGHYFGNTLASLNDCGRNKRSFKRIADIIEKNVENL